MSSMRRGSWFVALAFCLSFWMGVLGSLPGNAVAGLVPSHGAGTAGARDYDLRRIQAVLERDIVREQLVRYGVPHQAAMEKVRSMNDEDLHHLAAMTDRLPEGSGEEGVTVIDIVQVIAIVGTVVLVILVILGLIGTGYLAKYLYKKSKSSGGAKPSAPEPEPAPR